MDSFAEITALAALSVVAVQQLLKLNVVPLYFANKYPVLTNVVLSVIAALVVTWQTTVVNLTDVWDYVVYIGTISVLAAITYNMTLRNSESVQRASSKTE